MRHPSISLRRISTANSIANNARLAISQRKQGHGMPCTAIVVFLADSGAEDSEIVAASDLHRSLGRKAAAQHRCDKMHPACVVATQRRASNCPVPVLT